MDASIETLARRNHSEMLRAVASVTGARIAELIGVSGSTVSRLMAPDGDMEKLAAYLAACGLRVVRADSKQVDSEHLRALTVLAARSIKLEAQTSGWGDLL